jgi:hypothetical protein
MTTLGEFTRNIQSQEETIRRGGGLSGHKRQRRPSANESIRKDSAGHKCTLKSAARPITASRTIVPALAGSAR